VSLGTETILATLTLERSDVVTSHPTTAESPSV
jgi:hypothetical protein